MAIPAPGERTPAETARILEVFNGALGMIDSSLVDDIDEDSPEAIACRTQFGSRYRSILRLGAWEWAIERASLAAPDATSPIGTDWASQYTLPADLVKIAGVVPRFKWEVEKRKLLCARTGTIIIRYVAEVGADLMDGQAQTLLELRIARSLATRFGRDEEMARRLAAEYREELRYALESIQAFVKLPSQTFESALLTPGREAGGR